MKQYATFTDRDLMKVGHPTERLHQPPVPLPAPKLPIDWAKNFGFPILGNDIYGDCMMAAAAHGDNTFSGNNGAESVFNASEVVTAYLKLSGGNNGLNSGQIIGAWKKGLPGIPQAKIMDALDIDTKNAQLVQMAIWLFGEVFFTLKIPDDWYKGFSTGGTWDAPAKADSKNGHGVWWNGVDAQGHYHLETWGTYGWITPAGVADCDPGGLVVFSQRWFDANGNAPNGFSYSQLATWWKQMGGKELPVWPTAPTQGDRLLPGQGLKPGMSLRSADRRFALVLQFDGNLVLAGPQDQPLWAAGTSGHTDVFDVIMQGDGNLVMYNGENSAFWSSKTNGQAGAHLLVQNDGNVVIYNSAGKAIWATNTVVPPPPVAPTQVGRLLPGQGLVPGGSVRSVDGKFALTLQGDGNLMLAGPGGEALWSAGISGHRDVWSVVMQADGNLVIGDSHGHALWASKTNGKPGASLTVQTDGNVVISDTGNHPVWSTKTTVPGPPGAPTQVGKLLAGQGLLSGQSIKSADGRFTLTLQTDGNLVLGGPSGQALWASETTGKGPIWSAFLAWDLVLCNENGKTVWSSGTNKVQPAFLIVQDDGNVVIYDGKK